MIFARVLVGLLVSLVAGSALAAAPRLEVLERIDTGSQPKGVSVSPDGSRLYVTIFGRPDRENVWVYDARTLRRVGTVSFAGNAVESLPSHDGRTLYVTNFRRNRVEVIDTRSLEVVDEIEVGKNPKTMALSRDGKTLFVANWSSHTVSVVDLERKRVVHTLRTGENPRGMATTREGRLFVASFADDVIDVFDHPRADEQHDRRLRVCAVPRHLVLSPDEDTLYVSCYRKSLLGVVDLRDWSVERLPIGRSPKTIDITSDGRWVVSADYGEGTVSVVDTRSMQMRRTWVPELTMATGLAVSPTGQLRVYATSFDRNELFVMGVRDQDAPAAVTPAAPSSAARDPEAAPAHEVSLREAPSGDREDAPARAPRPAPREEARPAPEPPRPTSATASVARLEDE
jgi:YVTN family beta-propeller protein